MNTELIDKTTLLVTQALAFAFLACTVCGIVATALPQHWRLTQVLTKIGALTFRAVTKTPPTVLLLAVGLAISTQACSLESARYRRAASSPLDAQVRMAQSTRPVAQCQTWDSIHVWGDWSAGGLAAVASGAGIVAAGVDDKSIDKAMLWTGVVAGGAAAVAVGLASQSASSWEAAGCGQ